MIEKRYTVGLQSKTIFDMKTELYLFDNKIICEVLNAQNSLICEQQATINELKERNAHNFAQNIQLKKQIKELKEENGQLRRLFEEMKQPITINLTEEDEKELRKLLGLIDDE